MVDNIPKMQVAPESLSTAARDLAAVGSDINFARLQAATPTTSIASAANDEVSTAIVRVFGDHALEFQKVTGQAAEFHDQFIQNLASGANTYASAEAANAAVMALENAPQAAAAAALPAEDNGWVTLIQLGALAMTPFIFGTLLIFAAGLLGTWWAAQLFGNVVLGGG